MELDIAKNKKNVVGKSEAGEENVPSFWTIMKRVIIIGSITFLIISCIVNVMRYFDKKDLEKLLTRKRDAIAKVLYTGNMKGNYAVIEYYVDGIKYEAKESIKSYSTEPGEYFKMIYDSLAPKAIHVYFECPLFLTNNNVDTTEGRIIYIDDYAVRFSYTVGHKEYLKFQDIGENQIDLFKKNDIFTVRYKRDEPLIAIIELIPKAECPF